MQVLEDTAPATGNYLTMGSVLLAPTSIGSLKLNTSNVWDQPIIDTAFMSTEYDRYVMQTGKLVLDPLRLALKC